MIDLNGLLLAAGSSRFSEWMRYLGRAGSSRENLLFLLFALMIAGVWIGLFVWDRIRRSAAVAQSKPPRSVFEGLCQAHRLDSHDTSLLTEAARQCGLATPSMLFVQPDHLTRLSAEGQPNAAGYRQLRERLFGAL